jgi:AcrR family transcriptional regulator
MTMKKTGLSSDAKPTGRRRLPVEARRAEILREAAEYFAHHGFSGSTRELASTLGITQALIYKHFESKDDLIEKTLEAAFGQTDGQSARLDAAAPLEQSLNSFYKQFVARATETRMRLFIRAGLDGRSWPTRRGNALTRDLFLPIIAALRKNASLPDLDQQPAMRGERELVMMLHASMVFLGIRRHVYGMPMPSNLDDIVDLYVSTFVQGALPGIRNLHEAGEASLKVTLLAPAPDNPSEVTSSGRKRTSNR